MLLTDEAGKTLLEGSDGGGAEISWPDGYSIGVSPG